MNQNPASADTERAGGVAQCRRLYPVPTHISRIARRRALPAAGDTGRALRRSRPSAQVERIDGPAHGRALGYWDAPRREQTGLAVDFPSLIQRRARPASTADADGSQISGCRMTHREMAELLRGATTTA